MKYKKVHYKKIGNKYFVRVDKGFDLVEKLTDFCRDLGVNLGTIHGIGAADEIAMGSYNKEKKAYDSKMFKGFYELVSISGNVTIKDSKPIIHLHAVIADENFNCYGGHLLSARIVVTFEGVIQVCEGFLERAPDQETGANLWKM